MRVLLPYPRTYGYFPDIYEYVNGLQARGVDVRYVGVEEAGQIGAFPSHIIHLPGQQQGIRQFAQFVNEQVEIFEPDIVHVFHFRGCGLLPLLARRSNMKWLVDVRTIHVQTKGQKVTSDFWLRDRLTWLETQPYESIIALTEKIRQTLSPSVRPIQIVPLGASQSKLNPPDRLDRRRRIRQQWDIPADVPVLLYAGALSPTRRIDKLITAFSMTQAQWPEARLLVVGGETGHEADSDPSIAPLRQLAEDLEVARRVIFTGRVPYWDVFDYFTAADIGASFIPSDTPYNFQPPTKLIEYMMAGLIGASNRVQAIDDLVEDGVDGILFGDAETEIAGGLGRALSLMEPENEDARLRMLASAAERVQERDWSRIIDRHIIPLYEQLLEK